MTLVTDLSAKWAWEDRLLCLHQCKSLTYRYFYNIKMSGEISLLSKPGPQFKHSLRSKLLMNYDPTAYPPDLEFAAEHGRAQRVGKAISPLQNVQRCRCCLEPIYKEQIQLSCELSALRHCGQSTPLYFTFAKQVISLLIFNVMLISIPLVLINFVMGTECKIVNDSITNIFNSVCRGSAINIMNIEVIDAMQIEAVIFFVAVVLNIIFISYLETRMEDCVAELTRNKLSAADYSFIIKGLPSDITVKEIQKYVEDKMLFSGAPDVTIIKIYLIYNFKEYLKLLQTRQKLNETTIQLKFQEEKLQHQNLQCKNYEKKLQLQQKRTSVNKQIINIAAQLEKLQAEISTFEAITNELTAKLKNQGTLEHEELNKNMLNFSGKCIVTTNNKRSRQVIIQANRSKSCFHSIAYRLSELLQGKKSKIVITPAPEPSDILFGNMGSKKTIVWKKRIMYSSLIFVLILFDFLIVAFTKKFLKEEKAIQKGNILFSFLNSIIVSLFCSIFRRIIGISEAESYYTTISKMSYNKVAKMVFIFQINMLFTTFVANVASFYLIREDTPTFAIFPLNFETFLFDIFFLIVTNPIITLFMTFFDHRHIRGLIKKYRISKGWLAVSQAEANISYQNMNFDICYKYGTMYRFLLFSAGIAIIYPLCFFICLFAISCLYWLDKYLLLRRYSITDRVTYRFTLLSQKIMGQFPIYLSLSNFLVMFIPIQDGTAFEEQKYSKAYYYLSVIALILSFVCYFAGNGWIKALIRMATSDRQKEDEAVNIPYKDIQNNLLKDYSHDYPYFRVSDKIQIKEGVDAVRKEKLKELRENQKLGVFDVLQNFIAHHRYT